MEWSVAKIGIPMFDALHAYGFALLLALMSGGKISLQDEGLLYKLSLPLQTLPHPSEEILDTLFQLPNKGTILADSHPQMQGSLELETLDGLLATLFTMPGIRVASVDSLRKKHTFDPTAVEQALRKVAERTQEWKKAFLQCSGSSSVWIADLLQDYQRQKPAFPLLTSGKAEGKVTAPMTLDPAFGCAFRAAINTGRMTRKTQVTVRGARYATVLALLGATRFLRAQYVAGNLVLFVVPIAHLMTIQWQSSRPMLSSCHDHLDHALMRSWLNLHREKKEDGHLWSSLAYSVFQLQGIQQSIVCESGDLSLEWLITLQQHGGRQTISTWRYWLQYGKSSSLSHDVRESLIACLRNWHMCCWSDHLHELATSLHAQAWKSEEQEQAASSLRAYTLEEVRRIAVMMDHPSPSHPLRAVLEREEGTLCFGRALRLLGRFNHALFCDFLDQLRTIRKQEDLFSLLSQIIHECELAAAHERYILVPTEDDFGPLLDDIHQFGVQSIIGMLLVLSAVRYPRTKEVEKYALHTLIGALLVLCQHIESLKQGEQGTNQEQTLLPIERFLADPDLLPHVEKGGDNE